jgi:Family of unknown function (DUF6932)
MPIPPFDGILNVLPPHLGNPTLPQDLSPYLCTARELCDRFATSPIRKTILEGFLKLREGLLTVGVQGFQWLGGSFLEDIEAQESREPHDIDVITYVAQPSNLPSMQAALGPVAHLWNRTDVRATFHVDHFLVPLCSAPELVVDFTRYWYGLFSHRRDRTWKGMLRVNLTVKADDDPAWQVLGSKP